MPSTTLVELLLNDISRRGLDHIKFFKNSQNYLLGGSTVVAFEKALSDGLDYLICYHGDGQASPKDLKRMVGLCEREDADFFLGSRLLKDSQVGDYSALRTWGNQFFSLLQRVLFNCSARDLGAFIGFNMKTVAQLDFYAVEPDMGYHPHLILFASKNLGRPLQFTEFAITWGEAKVSHVKPLSYGLKHLYKLLKLYALRAGQHSGEPDKKHPNKKYPNKKYSSEQLYPV